MDEPLIETAHSRVQVTPHEQVHLVHIFTRATINKPAIISVHGTGGPGYGDTRWRLRLGRAAAKQGFSLFLFDSRGTGYSDGEYADWTVSKFVEDTCAVLKWVSEHHHSSSNSLGLFGFSLGSAVSVLAAAQHPELVQAIVAYTLPNNMQTGFLWYFERFQPGILDKLYTDGQAWVPMLGETMKVGFLEDLCNHDVKEAIETLEMPLLWLQPDEDDQVPEWVSSQAFELKPEPKQSKDISGTHLMHYKKADNREGWNFEQEQFVTREALAWFGKHLT